MSDLEIVAKLSANIEQFRTTMSAASQAMADAVSRMNTSLNSLTTSSSNVNSAIRQMGYNTTNAINNMANQTNASLGNISSAISEMSQSFSRITTSTNGVSTAVRQMGYNTTNAVNTMAAQTNASLNNVSNSVTNLANTYAQSNSSITASLNRLNATNNAMLSSLNLNIQRTREELAGLLAQSRIPIRPPVTRDDITLVDMMTGSLGRMFTAYQVFRGVRGFGEAAADMELLHTRLDNITGSVENGAKAFDFITQKAVNAPQTIDQITESFLIMTNAGMKPMEGNLQHMIDIMSKYNPKADALKRVTQDISHAYTLGHMQLRQFNAMALNGIPVMAAFQEMTGKTRHEIHEMISKGQVNTKMLDKLLEQLGKMSEGAAAEQMNTLVGKFSLLHDSIIVMADDLNKVGAFEGFKKGIQDLVDKISELRKDGSLGDFARVVGYSLSVVTNILRAFGELFRDVFGLFSQTLKTAGNDSLTFGNLVGASFFTLNAAVQTVIGALQVAVVGWSLIVKGAKDQIASYLDRSATQWDNLKIAIVARIDYLKNYLKGFQTFVQEALSFNLQNASSAFDSYATRAAQSLVDARNKVKANNDRMLADEKARNAAWFTETKDANKKIADILYDRSKSIMIEPPKPKSGKRGSGFFNAGGEEEEHISGGKSKRERSKIPGFQEELSQELLAKEKEAATNNQFYGKQLQDTKEFWERKLTQVKAKSQDAISISRKIAEADRDITKQGLQEKLDILKLEEQAIKYNFDKKIALANQQLAMQQVGTEAYRKAAQHVIELENQKTRQQEVISTNLLLAKQQDREDDLQEEKAALDYLRDTRAISNEEYLRQLIAFHRRKKQILLDGIQLEIDLEKAKGDDSNPERVSQLEVKKSKTGKAQDGDILGTSRSLTKEMNKDWDRFGESFGNSFSKHAQDVIKGQKKVKDAFREMAADMVLEEAGIMAKRIAIWTLGMGKKLLLSALGQKQETAITAVGEASRTGIEEASSAKSILMKTWDMLFHSKTETVKTGATAVGSTARTTMAVTASGVTAGAKVGEAGTSIIADAWAAAAGAAKAVASIPVIGPVLAVGAFGAIAALVLGALGNIGSAEGGADIGNVNPFMQLHKREMVLPEKYADVIRSLSNDSNSPAGDVRDKSYSTVNNLHLHGIKEYDTFRRSKGQALYEMNTKLKTRRA